MRYRDPSCPATDSIELQSGRRYFWQPLVPKVTILFIFPIDDVKDSQFSLLQFEHETLLVQSSVQQINNCVQKYLVLSQKLKVKDCGHKDFGVEVNPLKPT